MQNVVVDVFPARLAVQFDVQSILLKASELLRHDERCAIVFRKKSKAQRLAPFQQLQPRQFGSDNFT
jgi:hypothetical protein